MSRSKASTMKRRAPAKKSPQAPQTLRPVRRAVADAQLRQYENRLERLRAPTRCVRIDAGHLIDKPGLIQWWAGRTIARVVEGADVQLLLPVTQSKKVLLATLAVLTRAIEHYWPRITKGSPLATSLLVNDTRERLWAQDRAAEKNRPPVDDADPQTWPKERFDAAMLAIRQASFFAFVRVSPKDRARFLRVARNRRLAADAETVIATTTKLMDGMQAGGRKGGGR